MILLKSFMQNMLIDWIREYNLVKFRKHIAKTFLFMYNIKVIMKHFGGY